MISFHMHTNRINDDRSNVNDNANKITIMTATEAVTDIKSFIDIAA